MIFFVVAIAAMVAIIGFAAFRIWTDSWNSLGEKTLFSFAALFFTLVGGFCVLMLSQIIMWVIVGEHPVKDGEASLAAVADNQGTSGSFFLGSGSIDSNAVFYYYEKNGNEYSLEYVHADDATVTETTAAPRVEFYRSASNNDFWYMGGMGNDTVKFFVPEGSILSNYTLDAE